MTYVNVEALFGQRPDVKSGLEAVGFTFGVDCVKFPEFMTEDLESKWGSLSTVTYDAPPSCGNVSIQFTFRKNDTLVEFEL